MLFFSSRRRHTICALVTGVQTCALPILAGTGKKQIGFHEVDLKAATRYAAEDADVTLRLWRRFKARLPAEGGTRIYEMVDRPLVPVIAVMESAGVKVDADALSRLSTQFAHQIADLEIEIQDRKSTRLNSSH